LKKFVEGRDKVLDDVPSLLSESEEGSPCVELEEEYKGSLPELSPLMTCQNRTKVLTSSTVIFPSGIEKSELKIMGLEILF